MSTAQDSLLLLGVGLLNILFAIVLAGMRARAEGRQAAKGLSPDLEVAQG